MNFLVKYIGGSRIYGLETADSDIDYRGVYIHTDPEKILRFSKENDVTASQEKGDDYVYYELWRYFDLLRKSNTQGVESLFIDEEDTLELNPLFLDIQESKGDLIDSEKLISSTKGYAHNEKRLAMGERSGQLGGKRKAQVEKYGFSPKNVCQLIRISYGLEFYQEEGVFPVKLKNFLPEAFDLAFSVKTQPNEFTKEQVEKICQEAVDRIDCVKDKQRAKFNSNTAVVFMKELYYEYLY
tara:strand:- start:107 stop:826 length:720 start_codon:yes stop_codon:yes gene_type:complete